MVYHVNKMVTVIMHSQMINTHVYHLVQQIKTIQLIQTHQYIVDNVQIVN